MYKYTFFPCLLNSCIIEHAIEVAINEMIANKNVKAISVGCKPSWSSSFSIFGVELNEFTKVELTSVIFVSLFNAKFI